MGASALLLACTSVACSGSHGHEHTHDGGAQDASIMLPDATLNPDGGSADGSAREPDASATQDADIAEPRDASADASADLDAELDSGHDAGPVPPHCTPSAGGPYYLLEGESVSITIVCDTGLVDPHALSFDPLPLGAAFDADTATLTWTPTLEQAATYNLTLQAKPWGETGTVKIAVADRWDDVNNVPVVDPTKYTEEYGLPVIHLTTDPGLNGSDYTPASIIYDGHTFTGAEAKTRGAFSSTYPKKSYTLKFTKADKFSEPNFGGGFFGKRKITLITSFDDNSYLRQRLSFELWNRIAPVGTHIAVHTYSAIVFLNGAYYGLYTVADHVDGYLMEDNGLDQNGNLYKARNHDADFRVLGEGGRTKSTLHDGYTKQAGMPLDGQPGAYDDLDALINWVETASDPDFASQVDTRIKRIDYEDWWIFVSFVMADDSAGKNSYHYHDPNQDPALASSLWRYIPWDMNQSFGQDWRTQRASATSTDPEGYYVNMNGLFERLLHDATLGAALRTRYGSTLHGAYDVDAVLALFDQMVPEIDASARRDEAKWSATYRSFGAWSGRSDFTTYEEELQYVRQWISDRHAYLDGKY